MGGGGDGAAVAQNFGARLFFLKLLSENFVIFVKIILLRKTATLKKRALGTLLRDLASGPGAYCGPGRWVHFWLSWPAGLEPTAGLGAGYTFC